MSNQTARLRRLIEVHLTSQTLGQEGRELYDLLKGKTYEAELTQLLDEAYANAQIQPYDRKLWDEVFRRIEHEIDNPFQNQQKADSVAQPKKFSIGFALAIAATISIIILTTIILFQKRNSPDITEAIAKANIKPGKNAATLTLGNGKKIILDEHGIGELAKEPGISITKNANGEIIYIITDTNISDNQKYNTLSTTNGETATVFLQDGTKVWLNAASSISYPSSFAAAPRREVSLSGEAYFEAAHDKKHPFIVKTSKQQVEVIGTQFDISAYEDDQKTFTTLLQGSVQVSNEKNEAMLNPGEQSILTQTGNISTRKVNAEQIVDWKNGFFNLNNETLETMMVKVGRWYNIKIQYNDQEIKDLRVYGSLSRFADLSKLLKTIERSGSVKFSLTGRTLTIDKID
ncbi:FecR family protein [Pedobacter paludis]|uniref:Anti-sigma factor n=1 Tax=Pedobacter paludis TaxID=2203212 RepID=A0A317F609_9SPHI|nr:FecR domain-containing protein [Pedobacter paludis]PWS33339.1 anti-sigma factor [Pedobacter paludis]